MLFPTTIFAVFFLCVYLLCHYLRGRPRPWKWCLLAASYIFYGYWDWRFLGLIAVSSVANHLAALGMGGGPARRRAIVVSTVVFNLGMLGFFKYYGFFVGSLNALLWKIGLPCPLPLLDIILPVGISFFTFQAMSYVLDVYRGELPPAATLLDFAVYLAFFPQLVAGPIVRASIFLPQLADREPPARLDVGRAGVLILSGLFKKIVIANYLAEKLVDPVFAHPGQFGAADILTGVYGYAVQIYCDFSAYSDIAIGLALLMGFHFPINFNAPYFGTSIQDFWRRWHISLSTWLRDYLYIPLGGSRFSSARTYRNLFLTFLLGGLWHGAAWTFIAWGALHGAYLMVERIFRNAWARRGNPTPPLPRPLINGLKRLAVFHLVCLSWVFFRSETFHDAATMLRQLGQWTGPTQLTGVAVLVMLVGFGTQWLDGGRLERLWNAFGRWPVALQGVAAAVVLTILLALGPKGVAPFIYFQF